MVTENTYLFIGEDEFRKNLALARLKDKLFGQKSNVLNYEVFYGKECRVKDLVSSLETASLDASRRLVVLKEPHDLPEEEKEALEIYLKKPSQRKSIFLIYSTSYAPDAVNIKHFSFDRLKLHDITAWIIKEFNLKKKLISNQAAELICNSENADPSRIFPLIEEISIYVGSREKITEADIALFTEGGVEITTFALIDAINQKNQKSSLKILRGLLRSESNPLQIIGLLNWHISQLIEVKKMLLARISKNKMLSVLGIGSYRLDKLMSQAQNLTLKQLRQGLEALLETDLMIKRSSVRPDYLVEMLVVRLSA